MKIRLNSRKRKIGIVIVLMLMILVSIAGVIAFQAASGNFSVWSKFDFGASQTEGTSGSFVSRFIFGSQPVSQYSSGSFSGRFGVLEDSSTASDYTNVSECKNLDSENTLYKLNASVSSAGTCFTVLANNVTLDCDGYAINYSQSSRGYALMTTHYNDTTIRNCEITQGSYISRSYAIYSRYNFNLTSHNNNITTFGISSHSIFNRETNESKIYQNTFSLYNLSFGVYIYGPSGSNNISNNEIETFERGSRGIFVRDDSGSLFNDNEINTYGVSSYGIYINNYVQNSEVNFNTINIGGDSSLGIRASSYSSENSFVGNSISSDNSGSRGVYITGYSINNEIINNTVETLSNAVYMRTSNGTNIYNNIFNSSIRAIISIDNNELYSNLFNTTKTASTNIIGGNYIGGNHWINLLGNGFSQTCVDLDKDGICDEAYSINSYNVDNLVLTNLDNVPPTVEIWSPENESYVNGRVSILASASDDSAINRVVFQYSNSTTSWTDISNCDFSSPNYGSPRVDYRCYWYTADFSPGDEGYDIKAVAYDVQGNTGEDVVHYIIDRNRPIIYDLNLNYPFGQSSVRDGQNVTLDATVSDSPYTASGIDISQVYLLNLNGSLWTDMNLVSGSTAPLQNSSWGLNVLVEGTTGLQRVNFRVYDAAIPTRNSATARYNVRIDNDEPTYSGLSSSSGNYNNTLAYFEVLVEDNFDLDNYIFSHNMDGNWVNDSSYLNDLSLSGTIDYISHRMVVYEGTFNYKFYVFDDAGNMLETSTGEINVLGNSPVPTVYLVSPEHDLITNVNEQNFTFFVSNTDSDNCSLMLDGILNQTYSSISSDVVYGFDKTLSEGEHEWYISCLKVEEEGEENVTNEYFSDTRYLEVDTVSPTLTIESPLDKNYSVSEIELTTSGNEDLDWCGYSLDGAGNVSMTESNSTYFNSTKTGLSVGDYSLMISCNDTANNYGSESVNFSIIFPEVYVNLTYPLNDSDIVRGASITNEDDLRLVEDTVNLTARVYNDSEGYGGATCYFYLNGSSIGEAYTNSSGECVLNYDKSSLAVGKYNLSVNYTYLVRDVSRMVNDSLVDITLIRYVLPNYVYNTTTVSGLEKFLDGDVAKFRVNVTLVNESGTFFYDPQNIIINATDSTDLPYPNSSYVERYRTKKLDTGQYESWVVVNQSYGTSYLRWKVWISDDDFSSYLGTALHTDVQIVNETTCVPDCSCAANTCTGSTCSDGCGGFCAGTKDCGGGTTTCTDECSPEGSSEGTCLDDTTLSIRTCGNYDSDSCLEWSVRSEETCAFGEVCSEGRCVDNCAEGWVCGDWSSCIDGFQRRACINTICELDDVIETRACVPEECDEDWTCEWTTCSAEDVYSYPYNCIDSNNCGATIEKPNRVLCGSHPEEIYYDEYGNRCNPNWNCTSWGECEARYSIADVIFDFTEVIGVQERICYDLKDCATINKTEEMPCDYGVPVIASETEWCSETYVELTEKDSGDVVARMKKEEIFQESDLSRLDISFVTTQFAGYCDYCFDGVKNYDEEDVDCGGPSCPECVYIYSYFNWAFWIMLLLWILLFTTLVIIWEKREKKRREREFKKSVKKFIETGKIGTSAEKKVERKIKNFFKGMFGMLKPSKKPKMKKVIRGGKVYEVPVEEYVIEEKREIVKPKEKSSLLESLKRKLQKMKERGYYGTAKVEKEIRKYEEEEKNEIKRFFVTRIKRFKLRRAEKKRINEREKIISRRYKQKSERKIEKEKRKVEKVKQKSERKIIKEKRKRLKLVAKQKKREKKKQISKLKKEIRKRKFASLMRKLRIWRKQGYYGTASLEKELKRLKEK